MVIMVRLLIKVVLPEASWYQYVKEDEEEILSSSWVISHTSG